MAVAVQQEEPGVSSYEKLLREQAVMKLPTKQKLLRVRACAVACTLFSFHLFLRVGHYTVYLISDRIRMTTHLVIDTVKFLYLTQHQCTVNVFIIVFYVLFLYSFAGFSEDGQLRLRADGRRAQLPAHLQARRAPLRHHHRGKVACKNAVLSIAGTVDITLFRWAAAR